MQNHNTVTVFNTTPQELQSLFDEAAIRVYGNLQPMYDLAEGVLKWAFALRRCMQMVYDDFQDTYRRVIAAGDKVANEQRVVEFLSYAEYSTRQFCETLVGTHGTHGSFAEWDKTEPILQTLDEIFAPNKRFVKWFKIIKPVKALLDDMESQSGKVPGEAAGEQDRSVVKNHDNSVSERDHELSDIESRFLHLAYQQEQYFNPLECSVVRSLQKINNDSDRDVTPEQISALRKDLL